MCLFFCGYASKLVYFPETKCWYTHRQASIIPFSVCFSLWLLHSRALSGENTKNIYPKISPLCLCAQNNFSVKTLIKLNSLIDGLHYLLEALCISNINLFEKSRDKNFLKSTINMNFSIFPSKNVVESFDGKFKSFDMQWEIKIWTTVQCSRQEAIIL